MTCELFDYVVNTVSKSLAVPAKLVTEVSTDLQEEGAFTYRKRQGGIEDQIASSKARLSRLGVSFCPLQLAGSSTLL